MPIRASQAELHRPSLARALGGEKRPDDSAGLGGARPSVGTNGKLKARDAMILQDRDLDKRDLRIRQEDEPLVAAGEPYASLDCTELQGVEPLAAESHNLEAYMRVVVVTAELSNSFSEGPAEERHVEHRHDANKRRPEFSVSYDLEGIGGRRLVRDRRRTDGCQP